MLPFTAGARPGKRNMIFLPNSANSRLLPERKPSPTPTKRSNEPTPQAIPNMVRKDRSLFAHRLRKICAKMSSTVRMIHRRLYIYNVSCLIIIRRSAAKVPRSFWETDDRFGGDGQGGKRVR